MDSRCDRPTDGPDRLSAFCLWITAVGKRECLKGVSGKLCRLALRIGPLPWRHTTPRYTGAGEIALGQCAYRRNRAFELVG